MSKWGLKEKLRQLNGMKVKLPVILSNEAKNHFIQSFRDQGFNDNGVTKWVPRKSNKNDKGRAILVKSGALRRSIKGRTATWTRIALGSYGLPYAAVHNYGNKKRGIPKRQFIGNSKNLNKKLINIVNREYGKIMIK